MRSSQVDIQTIRHQDMMSFITKVQTYTSGEQLRSVILSFLKCVTYLPSSFMKVPSRDRPSSFRATQSSAGRMWHWGLIDNLSATFASHLDVKALSFRQVFVRYSNKLSRLKRYCKYFFLSCHALFIT